MSIENYKDQLQDTGEQLRQAEKMGDEPLYKELEEIERTLRAKYEEELKEEDLRTTLEAYDAKWKELRDAISSAEGARDEERVLQLESEIYEVEKQRAIFLAQTSAIVEEEKVIDSSNEVTFIKISEESDALIDDVGEALDDHVVPIERGANLAKEKLSRRPLLSARQSLSGKLRRASIIALTFLSSLGAMKPVQTKSAETEKAAAVSTEAIPMRSDKSFETSKTIPWNPLRGDWAFHFNAMMEKDPDTGKIYKINPQAALFPINFETTRTTTEEGIASYNLPYTYARQFDLSPEARKNLNEGDYEKVEESIKQDLQHALVDQISGLSNQIWGHDGMGERRTRGIHGEEQAGRLKIESIRITGYASEEGPASEGVQTLHEIDPENIRLATARAAGGMEALKSLLMEKGMSEEDFNKVLVQVSGHESQFSDQETVRLAELAESEAGIADDEKILNLIKKYNAGEITDPAVKSEMDQIVASKRRVEFQIEYENKSTSRYVIPIPAFLLLLPAIGRLRRRKEEYLPLKPDPVPGPDPLPEPVPFPVPVPVKPKDDSEYIQIPAHIEKTPMWEGDSEEYRRNQLETYTNDIWVFFDEKESIRKGVDYRDMCDSMLARYDKFVGENPAEDRELFLTYTMLSAWRDHDLISRQEVGWDKDAVEEGLNYEENAEQIRWARMHAKALMYLVEAKRDNPKLDYLDILEGRASTLLNESYSKALKEKRSQRSYRLNS